MADQVIWEDPRPPRNGRGGPSWWELLEPVMERPGEWARVREMLKSSAEATVQHLKRRVRDYPPGRWEFRSRRTGQGMSAIYARYLGPEDGGGR